MADVKVKMLRDVGGYAEGATRTMPQADAARLEARGVVQILSAAKKAPATTNKMAPRTKSKAR